MADVSLQGKQHKRPFNRDTFGKTISKFTQFDAPRDCHRRINQVVLATEPSSRRSRCLSS